MIFFISRSHFLADENKSININALNGLIMQVEEPIEMLD
jgi:hypothetical protein